MNVPYDEWGEMWDGYRPRKRRVVRKSEWKDI